MKESNPTTEPIGHDLINLISNRCFAVFVFSVLIFTVIGITYQPPDPWLDSASSAMTELFIQCENASFKNDNSILQTGKDFLLPVDKATTAATPAIALASSSTNDVVIEKSDGIVSTDSTPKLSCDELERVNCSDPRALVAVKKFNSRLFRSIVFLDYQTPVNGSILNECDVSWRFRNRKENSFLFC